LKEKEKVEWEAKMYEHHNQEIERTNERLKGDLEKLLVHLESLKKNNRCMSGCIKEYSDTGNQTAKKILQLINK
jgi:ferredoxin-thioredoxin reductase catalytic subunit